MLVAAAMLIGSLPSAHAEVSINIGINMPTYPDMVLVPGYPVYYDPHANSNYFFYDGEYWAYENDNWYSSNWYNGPWDYVEPNYVPLFLLRVPVRYYRQPPAYFRGWIGSAPPRWGDHWGRNWQQQRRGWDQWNRRSVPAAAPLPAYQRNYSGDRYPRAVEQQHSIRSERYRYQPRESITRQHFEQRSRHVAQRQRNEPNSAPNSDQRPNRESNRTRTSTDQQPDRRTARPVTEQPVAPRVTPPVRRTDQARQEAQPQPSPERATPERERQRESRQRDGDRDRDRDGDNASTERRKKPDASRGNDRDNSRGDRDERRR